MSGSCTISYRSSWRFRWDLGGASQHGHDSEGSTVKRLLHVEKRWEFSPSHGPHKGPPHLKNKGTHWAPDSLLHWTTVNLRWRKECLSFYSIQCCVGIAPWHTKLSDSFAEPALLSHLSLGSRDQVQAVQQMLYPPSHLSSPERNISKNPLSSPLMCLSLALNFIGNEESTHHGYSHNECSVFVSYQWTETPPTPQQLWRALVKC